MSRVNRLFHLLMTELNATRESIKNKNRRKKIAMASILHARKRSSRQYVPTDSSESSLRNGRLRGLSQWRIISKRIRWILATSIAILCVALSQHRQLIFYIVTNPWHHWSPFLSGEVKNGFQHHFYGSSPRFVVVVNSGAEVQPKNRHNRLSSIHATWGPGARAIFVVNNITEYPEISHAVISNVSHPSDPYSFPQLLLLPPEALPDQSVASLKYIVQTILERVNPDFAIFTNDHTYVIPDHLCHFLEGKSPSNDLYAGHSLKAKNAPAFHPESAGYILSRRSMQNLVSKWKENDPICDNPKQTHPGFFVSKCLSRVFGVTVEDTREDGKYNQFHSFPLIRLVTGKVDEWYIRLSEHENLFGDACCSDNTISFHYVEHQETLALFATRQAVLKKPDMSDNELKQTMMRLWPNKRGDVGGYSRVLPPADDQETWPILLRVMRKVSTLHSESSIRCL